MNGGFAAGKISVKILKSAPLPTGAVVAEFQFSDIFPF
jgi:hypothetical protein